MIFRVEITRTAAREVEQRYDDLSACSKPSAERWRRRLLEAVESLSQNPERYPQAPEAGWYGEGLRELYYGQRRNTYRILFEIRGIRFTSSGCATAGKTFSGRANFSSRLSLADSTCP